MRWRAHVQRVQSVMGRGVLGTPKRLVPLESQVSLCK